MRANAQGLLELFEGLPRELLGKNVGYHLLVGTVPEVNSGRRNLFTKEVVPNIDAFWAGVGNGVVRKGDAALVVCVDGRCLELRVVEILKERSQPDRFLCGI
jgi:hypothetical protein